MKKRNVRENLERYFLAALSGALLAFTFPPYSLGWLSWIVLIPLLTAIQKSGSPKEAAIVCGLAGLVFYSVALSWFFKLFGPFAVSLFCFLALLWCVFGFLYFSFSERDSFILAPVLWVGLEFLRSEVWYFEFPWLTLGLAHHTEFFSSTFQLASLWGVYGNSYLIVLVNILLSGMFFGSSRRTRLAFALSGIMIPLAIVPTVTGLVRQMPEEGRETRVLLVQTENYNLDDLIAKTLGSGFKGGMIVWPEYQVPILPGEDQKKAAYEKMSQVARETESVLVAGCAEFILPRPEAKTSEKLHNYAILFGPDGTNLGTYTKRHPIPFVEKFFLVRGVTAKPLTTPGGKVGIALCYDMDFSESLVKLGRNGAEIVVVPSLDPVRWGRTEHLQHAAITRVRAVESGKWIVRACSSGPSQIVDPSGKEVSRSKFGEDALLEGSAAFTKGMTFYHRALWFFPWVCLGLSALVVGAGLVRWLFKRSISRGK